MEQSPQQLANEYVRKLSKLHWEVSTKKITEVEAKNRLNELKAVRERLTELGVPEQMQFPIPGDPLDPTLNPPKEHPARKPPHLWSANCQCKRCVRFSTITMQDRDLLKSMGIVWRLKTEQNNDLGDSLSED